MNPMQAPNVGPGGEDFGNREKVVDFENAKKKKRKEEEKKIVKDIIDKAKKLDW